MTDEKLYHIALSLIPNIGPVLSKQLLNHFGTPQEVFKAKSSKLARVSGVGDRLSKIIPDEKSLLGKAEKIFSLSEKENIDIHYYKEESYPSRLVPISDAPLVLYSKGNLNMNTNRQVGIVGTRKATRYGLDVTENIVHEARSSNITVISGLAYGIDVKAHKASLEHQIPTIGVLACGLDYIYPTRHGTIADKMLGNGGLVSEYPVGTKVDPRFFPARNRIIAGLSDAVIVVEAAKKGGALITGNIAFGYDRLVFAVPGDLKSSLSEGCNNLIKQLKAGIYTSFNDVSEALNWDVEKPERVQEKSETSLSPEEEAVVKTLLTNGRQMHLDQLSWQSQIPLSQLAGVLLQLEFSGRVKPLPGKEYRLN